MTAAEIEVLRKFDAGWSSLVARRAHNPKVVGSNPAPATNKKAGPILGRVFFVPARKVGYCKRKLVGLSLS